MSARIGTVLNGRKTYIGGAPRSLDRGQVLLFEPAVNADDETLHITPDHYLTGDQFGASFGYDIALVDFNSDGWVDLWSVRHLIGDFYAEMIPQVKVIYGSRICDSWPDRHLEVGSITYFTSLWVFSLSC